MTLGSQQDFLYSCLSGLANLSQWTRSSRGRLACMSSQDETVSSFYFLYQVGLICSRVNLQPINTPGPSLSNNFRETPKCKIVYIMVLITSCWFEVLLTSLRHFLIIMFILFIHLLVFFLFFFFRSVRDQSMKPNCCRKSWKTKTWIQKIQMKYVAAYFFSYSTA